MSDLNMINNENMISAGSSNNLSGLPPAGPSVALQDSNDNRMMELRVAEQSLDFSNRNFSREVYIYHKKQERFKKTVMGVHTIVSKKLYRLSDLTLEEYFRSRWKISRAQVYRFLDAAEVLKQLSDFTFLPSHELLCRTLKQHAKSQEHMKILWENVLNKVNDHLTSINSSLISSTWLELVKDGKVVPLPPQPKKSKKRIRKNESTESEDLSTVKVIKTKHPNLNNDENKLAYNLLEYNEHQINTNIKTNNMGKRSGSFGRYNDEMNGNDFNYNQRDYYENENMNPSYGRPNSNYGNPPDSRSPTHASSNPNSPVNNLYMDHYRNSYPSYEMNGPERRNEMGRSDSLNKMPLPSNSNNPLPPGDRYYDNNYYRPDKRNGNSEIFKYEEREKPSSSYYYERPSSPGISNRRSSNFSENNRKNYSNYNVDMRNRAANPDEKYPPYMSNPNDRYYKEDFRSNRNDNDEDFYRYRNEPGEKMSGNFNKQLNRPLSPVSMNLSKNSRNDYPPLRDNSLPRPPNYYDDYREDPKKYKSYYYSSNHSPNQKNSSPPYSREPDQEKGNMKYISSPATNNPRLSNELRNLNGKTSSLPSNSNTIHTSSSSASAEINERDYRNRSSNSPSSSSNYPSYPPPPSTVNEDRYYSSGGGNPRESNGPNGNQNPPSSAVRPIPESMNTHRNYRSEPRYATRNNELPPKDLNSSKFLPPHQQNSPHNNQDIIPESNSRHYYSQPSPPPALSQRSPLPSYSTSNLPSSSRINYNSSSTNPPTDLNRFSLYKIPPQSNSPRQSIPSTLPPLSSLNNNNDSNDQKYNTNPSSSPYTIHPDINRNDNRNDNKSYANYRRESPVINGPNSGNRRPLDTNFDDYSYSRRHSTSSGRNPSGDNEPIYSDRERDVSSSHFSRSSSNGGRQSPYIENGSGSGPLGTMKILEDNRPLPPLPPTSTHSNHDLSSVSDHGPGLNGMNPDFYGNKMKPNPVNGGNNNSNNNNSNSNNNNNSSSGNAGGR